jgi:hypothetical protein
MISSHEFRTPEEAAIQFAEWASLFPDGLFVHIVVYVDDSGTHDPTGQQVGSREATVAGIMARREDWNLFCRDWQNVLNKYNAPVFHLSDWLTAAAVAKGTRSPSSSFRKNPYCGWGLDSLNGFILELAAIAGSGNKFIVGGNVYTRKFHEAKDKGELPPEAYPYEYCLTEFFNEFVPPS